LIEEHAGEGHGTADHFRPEHASVSISVKELGAAVTAMLMRDFVIVLCGEDVYLPSGFQQFSREEEEILALCGQFLRSFLVPGQEAVGDDGWLDRLAQG